MKSAIIVLVILILSSFLPFAEGASQRSSLDITTLIIKFDKTDAEFIVNYDIGRLPKLYIILMGSKSIKPKLKNVFSGFDYNIIKMDQDKAILHVKNISRYEKGFYLHDSIAFGETINILRIYMPDSDRPVEYYSVNSTPNKFYR
ncbi:MAG: hypothetical protein J5U17_09250 [Candidatus Methanoperedens sp.]|nr:hypothetical protein [Candidatus Methanoperedens sp.]MCE8425947.1 hypothetical protein [Candidatus Methanoperedens sp.]MCE8427376.1 hypothetical protein [Candidatus Methanoperedens sp.]